MADQDTPVKWDPNAAINTLKDRIRSEFIALIPPEQFAALVKKEVDEFFTPSRNTYQQAYELRHGFHHVVFEVCREEVKKSLSEYFNSPDWQSDHDQSGKRIASQQARNLIKEAMPEVIAKLLGDMFQGGMEQALYRLRNDIR